MMKLRILMLVLIAPAAYAQIVDEPMAPDAATVAEQAPATPEVSWSARQAAATLEDEPISLADRFYDLDDETQTALDALELAYDQELEAEMAVIRAKMADAYAAKVVALLPDGLADEFNALRGIVSAYEAVMAAAENAYAKAMLDAGVPDMAERAGSWDQSPERVARRLPGLTEDEQEAIKTIARSHDGEQREEVSAAMEARGVERPRRGGDRSAWASYAIARGEVMESMQGKYREAHVQEMSAALDEDNAVRFLSVMEAIGSYDTTRKEAGEALAGGLADLFGAEYVNEVLEDPSLLMRRWFRGR